jgi:hypothetical protein
MIIGITGGSGFIGQAVQRAAEEEGDQVILFSRRDREGRRRFSFTEPLDVSDCEGLVHLAGESIVGFWTLAKRKRILESRVEGTRRLVEGIAASSSRPKVLVSASAIGFYGNTGDHIADEDSPPGEGFLADVTRHWEAEALKAERCGVRVVLLRIGFVLGQQGGAMKMLEPVFRAGLGGKIGSGRQWMSCIEIHDLASMVMESLKNPSINGAVNAVMPAPVSNGEFTLAVARAVRRPAIIPAPAFALRLVLGDLSHLLLDSQRVIPKKFGELGFRYHFPSVSSAIQKIVGEGTLLA